MVDQKRILILADINQRAAIACLRGLRKFNVKIYLGFGQSSQLLRLPFIQYKDVNYVYFSKNKSVDFISSLEEICKEKKISIVIPTGEKYLRWIASEIEVFKKIGVQIPILNLEDYLKVSDKLTFTELCFEFGLNIPESLNLNCLDEASPPFVVKPKKNLDNSEIGAPFLVYGEKEKNALKLFRLTMSNYFFQELIRGESYYYCGYYINGKIISNFTQLNLFQQQNGKSIAKAIPSNIPSEISQKIDLIFKSFNFTGVMMVELIKSDQNNQFYAIECNPRFWGPLQLAVDNKINFPALICGFPMKTEKVEPVGYHWIGGVLNSYLKKMRSNIPPSVHTKDTNIDFKDVWFRKDTFIYFFVDLFLNIYKGLKSR